MNYLFEIETLFNENAIIENSLQMKSYMKNQFDFLGIQSESRKNISKEIIKKYLYLKSDEIIIFIKELWNLPYREYQYFAMDFFELYQKKNKYYNIEIIEFMIIEKSWWDTVDLLSSKIAGHYFLKNKSSERETTYKWNNSNNIWLKRASLLYQLKYKENTDVELLQKYIVNLIDEKDFFIKKAIGWILREYSKTSPDFVREFINNNNISKLSKKEATKYLI